MRMARSTAASSGLSPHLVVHVLGQRARCEQRCQSFHHEGDAVALVPREGQHQWRPGAGRLESLPSLSRNQPKGTGWPRAPGPPPCPWPPRLLAISTQTSLYLAAGIGDGEGLLPMPALFAPGGEHARAGVGAAEADHVLPGQRQRPVARHAEVVSSCAPKPCRSRLVPPLARARRTAK